MKKFIVTALQGFCMALADSVPGVSGGTVAFILGYYEKFINSLNALVSKDSDKKGALKFLGKLGIGWAIGLILASLVLSSVFETHIYAISSLFIGFILFAIPSIIKEEKDTLKGKYQCLIFTVIGIAVVTLLTYFNPTSGGGIEVSINSLSIGLCIYTFIVGMVAISAMVLPGISGSTILLICGLYTQIIGSIKEVLHLQLGYLPILIVFGLGVLTGIALIIKLVKKALDKHRTQTIYTVIGLMIGSLYAIVMGPTTLKVPQEAMSFGTFNILFFIIGAVIIEAMEFAKYKLANKKTDIKTTEEK